MFNSNIIALMALGHLVVMLLSIYATWKEHKGDNRSVVLSAYLYVAFISLLTVVYYAPMVMQIDVPEQLESAFVTARYMAIAFFLLGLTEAVKKKRVPWLN